MYTIFTRVSASNTGCDGKLKLASAIDMVQDCDLFWIESDPASKQFIEENNLGMVLMSRQIDVTRLPEYGEKLTVTTRIYECKGFLAYRNTSITDEAGGNCLLTYGIGAFVRSDTGQIARLPAEVVARVRLDERLDMEYLDRRVLAPKGEAERLAPFPVRRNDIDSNRHMNNARYLEAALELLSEDFYYDRVRIEYVRAARLGDTLYPARVYDEAGACFLSLNDDQGKPFAIMEFGQRDRHHQSSRNR